MKNIEPVKAKKKPVVIETVHFTKQVALTCWKDNVMIFDKLRPSGSYHLNRREVYNAYISIDTLEGTMRAELGDWIIKGVHGELYSCKPDIFKKTYEILSPARKNKTN